MNHRHREFGWLLLILAPGAGCAGMAFTSGVPDLERRLRAAANQRGDDGVDPEPIDSQNSARESSRSSNQSKRRSSDTTLLAADLETYDEHGDEADTLAEGLAQLPAAAQAKLLAAIREVRQDDTGRGVAEEVEHVDDFGNVDATSSPVSNAKKGADSSTTLRIRPSSAHATALGPQAERDEREFRIPQRPTDRSLATGDQHTAANVEFHDHQVATRVAASQSTHPLREQFARRDDFNDVSARSHGTSQTAFATIDESRRQPTTNRFRDASDDENRHWEVHLERAIRGLEMETQTEPASASGVVRHAGLRLLYLVNGQSEQASHPISGIAPSQQDFWSKQLFALNVLLDTDRNPDARRRTSEAALHLREAAVKLGELANLTVRNLTLCSEVKGFGNYKPLTKYDVRPGQRLLLYAEIDNFRSESHEDDYRTVVQGSYQLLDAHGERVAAEDFSASEDICSSRRHDLFVTYHVSLPTRLPPGSYTLQLMIEDAIGDKLGQSSLEITVHDR